jgi:hypothetical protein
MLKYFIIALCSLFFTACVSDSPTPEPAPTTDGQDSVSVGEDKPKVKAKTVVPDKAALMESSAYYRQSEIKEVSKSQIAVQFISETNDEADIKLQLLKDKSFQLHLLVIQDDFPLTLVGGYDIEGSDYILQFTDSELAKRVFSAEFNAKTNIKMISASEVVFPSDATSINIWGIACLKK